MGKYKVCVYAIAKNEEKNVDQWYNSMKEADEIYVLDTGSTDSTKEKLREKGVIVKQKIITPWRFDVARNESLKMVPKDTDIYVCTDIDEAFEPGWREELEKHWEKDATQANYLYIYSRDKYGKPRLSFYYDKIHTKNFEWECGIHEVLKYIGKKPRKNVLIPNITLIHYRDDSKDRSCYKTLLEEAVIERPKDKRTARLMLREYVIYREWENVIKSGEHYLSIDPDHENFYDSTAYRYIGRAYRYLKDYDNSRKFLETAVDLASEFREPYIELGWLEKILYNYDKAIELFEKAASIKEKDLKVSNEVFAWDETVYRELAECYKNKGKFKEAHKNILLAEQINKDSVLIQNLKKDIVDILKYNNEFVEE